MCGHAPPTIAGPLHADGPDRRRQDARLARLRPGACEAAQSRPDRLCDPVHLGHRPDGLHFSRGSRRRSRSRAPRVHRRVAHRGPGGARQAAPGDGGLGGAGRRDDERPVVREPALEPSVALPAAAQSREVRDRSGRGADDPAARPAPVPRRDRRAGPQLRLRRSCCARRPSRPSPRRSLRADCRLGPERELAPEPVRLHEQLKRVRLERLGDRTDDELVEALAGTAQGLVIVNSRAHALALYRKAVEAGLDGVVHLTTRQYAAHRRRILGDVRRRLANGKALPPDRHLAGRGRRRSRLSRASGGPRPGSTRSRRPPAAAIAKAGGPSRKASSACSARPSTSRRARSRSSPATWRRMMGKHADLLSPDAMRDYFGEVYWRKGEALDREKILDAFRMSARELDFDYRTVARGFPHDRERARSGDRRARDRGARGACGRCARARPRARLRAACSRSSFRSRRRRATSS